MRWLVARVVMENSTMFRQWIRDIGLATVLALPTVALSRPQPPTPERAVAAPLVEQAALADDSATERRYSLEG